MSFLELLAPAKDLECGLAAVDAGADAVYIGGPRFGAREDACNSLADIEKLVRYAHIFGVKIYVTLNTILYENEMEDARRLAWDLYNTGVDAFIFQDMAFLEMDMPPIPLHASTQTNNYFKEKVKFLGQSGASRVVLARELSIEQIKEIRAYTDVELECFIHGALCVSMSGQCYLSCSIGGRSANRGACAQPCRRLYSLKDDAGNTLIANKYLLSLKDMMLADYLGELADAGVNSLKIEGRLKDVNYVRNVTSWYRTQLDKILTERPRLTRPSYGTSISDFVPNPAKSFNRGTTDYFLHGRKDDIASFETPKSFGEKLGQVSAVTSKSFTIKSRAAMANNDGLMFFNSNGESIGLKVNNVEGNIVFPDSMNGLFKGATIYRNYDHKFTQQLNNTTQTRKLNVVITVDGSDNVLKLSVVSESGKTISTSFGTELVPAENRERSASMIKSQFSKSGNTPFNVVNVEIIGAEKYFFTSAFLNNSRRLLLESLQMELETGREKVLLPEKKTIDYLSRSLTYESNVSNSKAKEFYTKRGVKEIEGAFELLEETTGLNVMTTKHCLRYYAGLCKKYPATSCLKVKKQPDLDSKNLVLDDGKREYHLSFDCKNCFMKVSL